MNQNDGGNRIRGVFGEIKYARYFVGVARVERRKINCRSRWGCLGRQCKNSWQYDGQECDTGQKSHGKSPATLLQLYASYHTVPRLLFLRWSALGKITPHLSADAKSAGISDTSKGRDVKRNQILGLKGETPRQAQGRLWSNRRFLPTARDHLGGMLEAGFGYFGAAYHAGYFVGASGVV